MRPLSYKEPCAFNLQKKSSRLAIQLSMVLQMNVFKFMIKYNCGGFIFGDCSIRVTAVLEYLNIFGDERWDLSLNLG